MAAMGPLWGNGAMGPLWGNGWMFSKWKQNGKGDSTLETGNPVATGGAPASDVLENGHAPAPGADAEARIAELEARLAKAEADAEKFGQMVENLPINVMTCDLEDFKINYANPATIRTLKEIENLLPIKADELIGQSIDIFHKEPSHQRSMLANPNNLPHNAQIGVGDEILDLQVDAIRDGAGTYSGVMLSWSVITAKVKADADAARLLQMVDEMPINVMSCELEDLKINYVNKTSRETLRSLEHLLPVKADELLGQSIDIFHKNPEHQRRLLADPRNLPHAANITLGEETLALKVSAINDAAGQYIGPMLSWEVITEQVRIANQVKDVVGIVASAASELEATAQSMSATAEETSQQSAAVASASEQATNNVNSVASASEQLATSISEISRQVTHSTEIATRAVAEAEQTNETVKTLAEASQKIGAVVALINDIASQTNLLALNATIEAARAGEAGKGFAVVASEVKSLANQTAKATEEIAAQISTVQGVTDDAVRAIEGIGGTISQVSETATTIAAAVEEQGAATAEISRNVQEASAGTQEVTSNINGVAEAAGETGRSVSEVLESAGSLSKHAESLRGEVDAFLKNIGAA